MIEDSWITKHWPHSMGKWKYNYQLSNFGYPHVDEIKKWVQENPKNRNWGNMGYVACNNEEDAMIVLLRWG